jgi:hypothetical protein
MPPSESGLREFTQYLTRSGLKNTRQRERIVSAFFAGGRHISASSATPMRVSTRIRPTGRIIT